MGSNKLIDMTKPEGQQVVMNPLDVKVEKTVIEASSNSEVKPQSSSGDSGRSPAK